jgi:hypothetical protein
MTIPFSFKLKRHYTPKDNMKYVIPFKSILDTERVLREYARIKPANEGLVYWGGIDSGNIITIQAVIAPQTESDIGRVSTSHRSNFYFVRTLNGYNLMQVAQVHSHPSDWVEHSIGDDKLAAFKIEGLLSIVVPEYCHKGMLPLLICGIHRYTKGNFLRLSKKYVDSHFVIKNELKSFFHDLRK